MKITVFSDIHNDFAVFANVLKHAKKDIADSDLVVCNGDFIDMFKNDPNEWLTTAKTVFDKLKRLNKPLLCVPGNHDPPQFLSFLDKEGTNLHLKLVTVSGFDFIGFGGATTPAGTNFEPPEDEAEKAITLLVKKTKNPKVFVFHNPPKKTKLDLALFGQHVGSDILKKLIRKTQPALVLTAHIHESPGLDKIGKSVLFYPGPVFDGFYGIVTLGEGTPVCVARKV
ncbi:MAG: metallophosphoesterase [Candidatus Aenigmatarchaeota archaeon]